MTKSALPTRTMQELLNDPNVMTVTITDAARILGIARTTAHYAYTRTGHLIDGVPVITIWTGSSRERRVVSTAHLRTALGIANPE